MLNRRNFFASASLAGLSAGSMTMNALARDAERTWFMPDEGARHERTWMAFGASRKIWGKRLLPEVRRNLALIADTVSEFEPVTMLVRENEMDLAREMVQSSNVHFEACPLDDLWARDTAPLFVLNEAGEKAAIGFNFNGWGRKQAHRNDTKVAAHIAKLAGVPSIETDLTMEGGCIELDGEGTGIATESCILIKNRNPGWKKKDVEAELLETLGVEKMIWLPGVSGVDITDGHTDFYTRFVKPGVAVAWTDPNPKSPDYAVTKEHLRILEAATDVNGQPLEVIPLVGPTTIRPKFETEDFAAGYVGFYVCNDAVVLQEFGDKMADGRAKEQLEDAFPNRKIVTIAIDGIAAGGGSVHCATQQEPKRMS